MPRKVITAPEAAQALAAARLWLTPPGSGLRGRRRWERLLNAPGRLAIFPYSGEKAEHPGHYVLVERTSGYPLIYTIDPDTGDSDTAGDIRIVAVFGPGQ